MGTYSSYGLAFVTRGEGKSVAFKYSGGYAIPAPAQCPVISNDSLFTISSAPVPNFNNLTESVINYESRVPVYDGCTETGVPFHFSADNFNALPSWQSYNGNNSEILKHSVVAVGYTVGWFKGSDAIFLSTNVKFIIVLHTPQFVVVGGTTSALSASLDDDDASGGSGPGAPGGPDGPSPDGPSSGSGNVVASLFGGTKTRASHGANVAKGKGKAKAA
ncbi:hypothetical protein C0995_013741 [Termitomyces sp. Mi166|nr:hypothetical protein C0995_013741 [Termitomyces sp. Mi166\